MRRRPPRSLAFARGLTLIELMVALAVFAVLGTLTYRGTTQLFESRQIISRDLERWREIGRALGIIETDLLQLAAPITTEGQAPMPALELMRVGEATELHVLSLATGNAARRVVFRQAGSRVEWIRWPDREASGAAARDVLLENVAEMRWRFLTPRGWLDHWPAEFASADAVPSGVELQLDLPDTGTLTRFYALR